ncbi:hypothetical protein C0J52_18132 [Blattella germanica]|nr:hypothetical protein C0J52_18132 [Blattella germanica]
MLVIYFQCLSQVTNNGACYNIIILIVIVFEYCVNTFWTGYPTGHLQTRTSHSHSLSNSCA